MAVVTIKSQRNILNIGIHGNVGTCKFLHERNKDDSTTNVVVHKLEFPSHEQSAPCRGVYEVVYFVNEALDGNLVRLCFAGYISPENSDGNKKGNGMSMDVNVPVW